MLMVLLLFCNRCVRVLQCYESCFVLMLKLCYCYALLCVLVWFSSGVIVMSCYVNRVGLFCYIRVSVMPGYVYWFVLWVLRVLLFCLVMLIVLVCFAISVLLLCLVMFIVWFCVALAVLWLSCYACWFVWFCSCGVIVLHCYVYWVVYVLL